jgi:hypothetical protein
MKSRIPKFSRLIGILIVCTLLTGGAIYINRLNRDVKAQAACINLASNAEEGNNALVEEQLKAGTDPNCQNGDPVRSARRGNHEDTVSLLKRYGAKE